MALRLSEGLGIAGIRMRIVGRNLLARILLKFRSVLRKQPLHGSEGTVARLGRFKVFRIEMNFNHPLTYDICGCEVSPLVRKFSSVVDVQNISSFQFTEPRSGTKSFERILEKRVVQR